MLFYLQLVDTVSAEAEENDCGYVEAEPLLVSVYNHEMQFQKHFYSFLHYKAVSKLIYFISQLSGILISYSIKWSAFSKSSYF